MKEYIKSIGNLLLLLLIMTLPLLFIYGSALVAEKFLPWLFVLSIVLFGISVFVLLPLSFFKKLRSFTGGGLIIFSYVFGVTGWFVGLLVTWIYWGGFAVFMGLCFFGIGVVPIAILASAINAGWSNLFMIVFLLIATYGARIIGVILIENQYSISTKTSEVNLGVNCKFSGIYGWLLIPAIGLILSPIKSSFLLVWSFKQLQLNAPELLDNLLVWSLFVIDIFMIVFTLIVAVLFFSKKHIAVSAIISLMSLSIVFTFVQSVINIQLFQEFDYSFVQPVMHALVYALIWIPYFLKSKRVKNTFRKCSVEIATVACAD